QQLDEQIGGLADRSGTTQDDERRLADLRAQQNEARGAFAAWQNELDARYRRVAGPPDGLGGGPAALAAHRRLGGWVALGKGGARARMPYHWACVVRKHVAPAWVRIDGSGPEGGWTDADRRRPAAFRSALSQDQPGWRDLAASLARQRLEPL